MKFRERDVVAVDELYRFARKIIEQGRKVVSIAANAVLVRQNWSIGKLIVEDEQRGRRKTEYGKRTLEALSLRLKVEYGNGYDARNLRYMMREDDPIAREWYANECVACGKDDNPTVGIVLCDEPDAAIVRYSILHDDKNMFAVNYSTVMSSDEILRRGIESQKKISRLQTFDLDSAGMRKLAKKSEEPK